MAGSSHGWVSVSMPYVTPRAPGEREAWADEAAQRGGTGTQRLTEVGEVVPPVEVADALHVGTAPVVVRRRVILLDGQPVELADSYYPAAIACGTRLAEPRKIPGGAVTFLHGLGYRPRRAIEDVYARRASAAECSTLSLGDGGWVLVLFRVLIADGGLPVEASVMTTAATSRRLRYQVSIG